MAEFTREQLIKHINDMMESSKEMIGGNGVPVEFVSRAERDICVHEIALSALTAEPEVWEIENPGEGTFYSAHPPRDFEKVSCVYYRLPLLEGLK